MLTVVPFEVVDGLRGGGLGQVGAGELRDGEDVTAIHGKRDSNGRV